MAEEEPTLEKLLAAKDEEIAQLQTKLAAAVTKGKQKIVENINLQATHSSTVDWMVSIASEKGKALHECEAQVHALREQLAYTEKQLDAKSECKGACKESGCYQVLAAEADRLRREVATLKVSE